MRIRGDLLSWIACLFLAAVSIAVSWGFGGKASWVPEFIHRAGFVGAALLGWRVWLDFGKKPRRVSVGFLLALASWIGLLWVFRDMMSRWLIELLEDGFSLNGISHFTPASADMDRTRKLIPLFQGQLMLALVAGYCLRVRTAIRVLLGLLGANALVHAVIGGIFHFTMPGQLLGMIPAANRMHFGAFHYHNHWGGFALLGAAILFALGAQSWVVKRKVGGKGNPTLFYLVGGILVALMLPLGGGRTSSLMLLCLLVGAVALFVGIGARGGSRTKVGVSLVIGFLALASLVFAISYYGGEDLEARAKDGGEKIESVLESGLEADGRMVIMEAAWLLYDMRPGFGWGLGGFYPMSPVFVGPDQWGRPRRAFYAHNDYLQLLCEIGWIGTSLLLIVPIGFGIYCAHWGKGNHLSRFLALGVASILVMACYEFPFGNPAIVSVFVVVYGVSGRYALLEASGSGSGSRSRPRKSRKSSGSSGSKRDRTRNRTRSS